MKSILIPIVLLALISSAHAQTDRYHENKGDKPVRILPAKITYPAAELELFPNPATNQVAIFAYQSAKKEGFELRVYDNQGIQLVSQKWTGEKLDVSQFPTGHYVVVLRKDKLVFSQKLVVARE